MDWTSWICIISLIILIPFALKDLFIRFNILIRKKQMEALEFLEDYDEKIRYLIIYIRIYNAHMQDLSEITSPSVKLIKNDIRQLKKYKGRLTRLIKKVNRSISLVSSIDLPENLETKRQDTIKLSEERKEKLQELLNIISELKSKMEEYVN